MSDDIATGTQASHRYHPFALQTDAGLSAVE
jgi:hypothetical protein